MVGTVSAVTIPGAIGQTNTKQAIPVIILHGTMDSAGSWSKLAEELCQRGRTVVLPSYGQRGTASVSSSLKELEQVIAAVLQNTEATCVDIVGHSQGGLLAYLIVQNMMLENDGALPRGSVRKVVSVSGSTKGAAWPRPFALLGYHASWLAGAIGGAAMKDQVALAKMVAKKKFHAPLATFDSSELPTWVSIVSAGDGIVPPASALTDAEYPGATIITTEEALGRSIMHWLQQRDPEVVELIVRELV